jgi:hypothetical protein
MNSPAQDLKDLLEASSAGTGLTFGTDLFVGHEPDGGDVADKVVTIYDTSGGQPDTNRTLTNPTVQVRVRGDVFGYQAGYTLAETVFNTLHTVTNTTVNSTRYIHIIAMGDLFFLGFDDNKRPTWSVNFSILRTA